MHHVHHDLKVYGGINFLQAAVRLIFRKRSPIILTSL
jgi:hypothetical protein